MCAEIRVGIKALQDPRDHAERQRTHVKPLLETAAAVKHRQASRRY